MIYALNVINIISCYRRSIYQMPKDKWQANPLVIRLEIPIYMYVMKIISFCIPFVLVSCSGDEPDITTTQSNDEANIATPEANNGSLPGVTMIGGGVCIEASIPEVIGTVDDNGDFVPVDVMAPAPQDNDQSMCDGGVPEVIDAPGIIMSGSGSIELGTELYTISGAMVSSLSTAAESEHMRNNYYLIVHDGETRVSRFEDEAGSVKIDYGMTAGSVAFALEISTTETSAISGRTFEISDIGDISTATDAEGDLAAGVTLLVDHDANGRFTFEEVTEITEGQVTWVGLAPNVEIVINALTANGLSINGRYTGDVVEVPNE